jgi:hypothetical protein
MREIDAQIHIHDLWIANGQQINDTHIMDVAMRYTQEPRVLKMINRCRIFNQAITIADITSYKGTYITRAAYGPTKSRVKPTMSTTRSTLTWPNHPCPGFQHWTAWRKFLNKQYTTTTDRKLKIRLGRWPVKATKQRNRWNEYYDPNIDILFRYNHANEKYDGHTACPDTRGNEYFNSMPTTSTSEPTDEAQPIEATNLGHRYQVMSVARTHHQPQPTTQEPTT